MNLTTKTALITTLTLAALASATAFAQNAGRPNRFLPKGTGAAQTEAAAGETARPPRPVPPIIAALDANQDGELDAAEIANAATALKTLDKNGDGKLTADEIRQARPEGGRGPRH